MTDKTWLPSAKCSKSLPFLILHFYFLKAWRISDMNFYRWSAILGKHEILPGVDVVSDLVHPSMLMGVAWGSNCVVSRCICTCDGVGRTTLCSNMCILIAQTGPWTLWSCVRSIATKESLPSIWPVTNRSTARSIQDTGKLMRWAWSVDKQIDTKVSWRTLGFRWQQGDDRLMRVWHCFNGWMRRVDHALIGPRPKQRWF